MDSSPTIGDLLRCCRRIQGHVDLSLLAVALDAPDNKFEEIRCKYKNLQGQGLQLMKIWLTKSGALACRCELVDLFLSASLGIEAVDVYMESYHTMTCV